MAYYTLPSTNNPTQNAIQLKSVMDQGGNESDAAYKARIATMGGFDTLTQQYNTALSGGSVPGYGTSTYTAPAPNTTQTKNAPSTYSKSGVADALGISTDELESRAKDAGYSSTESYYNSGKFKEDQLDSYYDPSMKMLNAQQTALMGNQGNFENIATSPYDQQVPLVTQAGQQGQNAIQGQMGQAGTTEQSALAAARRLYDELTSRGRQAFGSGALGSVGQAASEVLGRSAQEQFGNIRNTAGQTMQTLQTAARELQDKTSTLLNNLQLQKAEALSKAKMDFQDRLDYIAQQKNLVGQAKAAAKLSALQSYRDNIQQMASQAEQVKTSIIMQAQANGQNVSQALNQYYDAMGQGGQQGSSALNTQGTMANNSINNMANANSMSQAAAPDTGLMYGYGSYAPSSNRPLLDEFGNPRQF